MSVGSLFNPNHLQSLCQKYHLHPSRKYGQNFLINSEPVDKMTEAGDVKQTDTVIEIGPGFGVLTFALAERAKKVIAFEIEKKLAPYWEKHRLENLEIIWGNVLRQVDGSLTAGHYKVVANLPYQITSAVIRTFLESDNPPDVMVLMVQKEVAERICAKPGDMSLLSVAVQYYAESEIVTNVPRTYFWPEPKVDSAVIKLKIRKHLPAGKAGKSENRNIDEKFFKLVKAGFANRRKLLVKNLQSIVGKENREVLKQAFAALGLKETARAQELGVEQWRQLADKYEISDKR